MFFAKACWVANQYHQNTTRRKKRSMDMNLDEDEDGKKWYPSHDVGQRGHNGIPRISGGFDMTSDRKDSKKEYPSHGASRSRHNPSHGAGRSGHGSLSNISSTEE